MKTPLDCDAPRLVRALRRLGYEPVRQTGSHIRLVKSGEASHHITIPDHSPIKVGTLHSILKEVATHHRLSVEQFLERLDL
ncbi:MAG: type II toxin-antitoxin system HicA family toxin [Verrucomicrobia bacterium]|nr:type II toxin-antitoxin system HicA family toxin [Verrucomicrobiota bacterium]